MLTCIKFFKKRNLTLNKKKGNIGEKYTASHLKKNKYKIIRKNYSKKCGEIDIIAENKDFLVFVEVKTRNVNSLTRAVDAVGYKKRRRIINTAKYYLAENPTNKFCRFDICEVYIDDETLKLKELNYFENAFEPEDGYASY